MMSQAKKQRAPLKAKQKASSTRVEFGQTMRTLRPNVAGEQPTKTVENTIFSMEKTFPVVERQLSLVP